MIAEVEKNSEKTVVLGGFTRSHLQRCTTFEKTTQLSLFSTGLAVCAAAIEKI